jgi:hypothetical protein
MCTPAAHQVLLRSHQVPHSFVQRSKCAEISWVQVYVVIVALVALHNEVK